MSTSVFSITIGTSEPGTYCNSCDTSFGVGAAVIARIFSVVGCSPSAEMVWPRFSIDGTFALLQTNPCLLSTSALLLDSVGVQPQSNCMTRMSSMYMVRCSVLWRMLSIAFWKIAGTDETPNSNHLF